MHLAKKIFFLLCAAIGLSMLVHAETGSSENPPETYTFETYESNYRKKYRDDEDRKSHREAFNKNVQKIRDFNRANKGSGKRLIINEFADLTPQEEKSKNL